MASTHSLPTNAKTNDHWLTTILLLYVDRFRNIIFILFLFRYTRKTFYSLRGYGLFGSIRNVYIAARLFCYSLFLRAPGVRGQVDKQVSTAIEKLETKLVQSGPDVNRYLTLPAEGWSADKVREELNKLAGLEHTRWEDGRVSGAVYHGGEDLLKLQAEAFGQFGVANPIHPDVFPGVRKMEAEVVAMVCFSRCGTALIWPWIQLLTTIAGSGHVQCPHGWCWCYYQRRYRVHHHGLSGCPAKGLLGAGSDGA